MGAKAVSDATKWQIIAYFKLKYRPSKISSLCNVSLTCVNTTIKNYTKNGTIVEAPRSGRPRITTPRQDRELFRMSRINPEWSANKLTAHWKDKSTYDDEETIGSRRTALRRLNEYGIGSYVKEEKPLLTEANRKNRLEWCLERKNWSIEMWSKMINSDESNFQLIKEYNECGDLKMKSIHLNL